MREIQRVLFTGNTGMVITNLIMLPPWPRVPAIFPPQQVTILLTGSH